MRTARRPPLSSSPSGHAPRRRCFASDASPAVSPASLRRSYSHKATLHFRHGLLNRPHRKRWERRSCPRSSRPIQHHRSLKDDRAGRGVLHAHQRRRLDRHSRVVHPLCFLYLNVPVLLNPSAAELLLFHQCGVIPTAGRLRGIVCRRLSRPATWLLIWRLSRSSSRLLRRLLWRRASRLWCRAPSRRGLRLSSRLLPRSGRRWRHTLWRVFVVVPAARCQGYDDHQP